MPSEADVVARRNAVFKERLRKAVAADDLEPYLSLVEELAEEDGFEMAEIAAAAAKLARGDQPLGAVEPPPENVEIRKRPVHVKLASPSAHGGGAPAGDRKRGAGKPFRNAGKPPFKGRAASRRKGEGRG